MQAVRWWVPATYRRSWSIDEPSGSCRTPDILRRKLLPTKDTHPPTRRSRTAGQLAHSPATAEVRQFDGNRSGVLLFRANWPGWLNAHDLLCPFFPGYRRCLCGVDELYLMLELNDLQGRSRRTYGGPVEAPE
jgi:hypothetical protein